MGVEALPQELREPVGLLDGLPARERGDGGGAAVAQQALGLVERLIPRDRLEVAAAALA